MTTGWIYAVHDDDGAIVYVGQTIETPAALDDLGLSTGGAS